MKKYLFVLALLSLNTQAQNLDNTSNDKKLLNYEIQDHLVVSGFSKHTSDAPAVIGKWNEHNYGLGWQRSFKPIDKNYRYALEGGFFKESFGKQSGYIAGSWLKDLTDSPRLSLGVMAGLSYRVTKVKDGYYSQPIYGLINPKHTPIPVYDDRHLIGMAGIVAQLEIPYTPAVI